MNLGSRIKRAREAAGMSQGELARKADMSLKGMAYIERGRIEDPHVSSIIRIAGALGLSVDKLLAGEKPPSSKRLRETADALENIVERQRKRIEKWAEEGEVPLEGPSELAAFCDAIYRFFQGTGIASAADELWNSAPSDEQEEARRHAGRILEGMFHLNGIVAEARNTRRRLIKDIPKEIPALILELEEELERARSRQQITEVNG